ncbi:hypothetical protein [Actinomadura madurae]|uniref:hypothetical protein n=1 Tax=Actinomadura madurae TaxID=1993 RepID=UPI0020D22B5A|nr:hypothetical protein [Actinomadura madurae]MCP9947241.1 hypothetical protein [Actinomadura madurae]MCP9964004.1 hypothetical protein [Actinomadura madurae]MCP9976480.1 hypothetical protein [Actinomadura madurae]MCQ0012027.1 hypothetical protein [Actinomadura madurae]MCQ0012672.1 hypothetical protein [Actinomadura madurae]
MTDDPKPSLRPRFTPEQVERISAGLRRIGEAFNAFARACNDLHTQVPHLRLGGTMPERPDRDDEHLVHLSPGRVPPEAAKAIGDQAARRLNEPSGKGHTR